VPRMPAASVLRAGASPSQAWSLVQAIRRGGCSPPGLMRVRRATGPLPAFQCIRHPTCKSGRMIAVASVAGTAQGPRRGA
jgi:hypothetical protein